MKQTIRAALCAYLLTEISPGFVQESQDFNFQVG